ncbi:hypothetical protein SSPO_017640 [Streptomyces antimycoticus]|uniref:Lipoprotein n=1 Tax=Streptomyces antimycoticus TaxID=68175 RepID=A0A499UR97_9ACTN|nr:hypothetical protein [Streptomyces antimycoticus]BBJ39046.1 hypothetical protein SSPO_017640 [Streptomyces antimycoticus]
MYDAADADARHPLRPADRPPRRHGPRAMAVAAAVGALLTVAGCGGGDGKADAKAETGGNAARPSASPAPKAARVEQLASAAGCEPQFTTKVDDYRQAVCKTAEGKFVFLDFVTAKGQRDWLETRRDRADVRRVYLVGNRWVLSSSPGRTWRRSRTNSAAPSRRTPPTEVPPAPPSDHLPITRHRSRVRRLLPLPAPSRARGFPLDPEASTSRPSPP